MAVRSGLLETAEVYTHIYNIACKKWRHTRSISVVDVLKAGGNTSRILKSRKSIQIYTEAD